MLVAGLSLLLIQAVEQDEEPSSSSVIAIGELVRGNVVEFRSLWALMRSLTSSIAVAAEVVARKG